MPKKSPGLSLRTWRVAIIRKRGEYLGTAEAVDKQAAEVAAVEAFNLTEEQRGRRRAGVARQSPVISSRRQGWPDRVR
jgi:hypothetical protein